MIPSPRRSLMKLFRGYASSRHGAFRRSKYFSQRGHIYTRRAHQLALQRGHDAVLFPITSFSGCKVNVHMCRLCKARTGSSGWTQPCKKKSTWTYCSPSPAWWKRVAGANDRKPVAQILQLGEKKRLTSAKCWRSEGQFPCILYAVGAARGMCYRFIYVFAMRF